VPVERRGDVGRCARYLEQYGGHRAARDGRGIGSAQQDEALRGIQLERERNEERHRHRQRQPRGRPEDQAADRAHQKPYEIDRGKDFSEIEDELHSGLPSRQELLDP